MSSDCSKSRETARNDPGTTDGLCVKRTLRFFDRRYGTSKQPRAKEWVSPVIQALPQR